MARIAGVDLPREKRIEIGLTYIYGIGKVTANKLLKEAGINPDTRVKDLRQIRRKVETRIAKINTLKTQSARGRMLTKREMDAIYNLKNDIRKQEEIVEEYDNKKEIYSDKRIAYFGMDNELIKIFYKYSTDFEPYFLVTDKNVNDLKSSLDDSHNIKDNMNDIDIRNANEDRYGDEIVDFEQKADIYIVNTCSVTNIADRKSRQMLHKARKMNPNAIVVATGCYVQTDTEGAMADGAIDIVVGNNHKDEIVKIIVIKGRIVNIVVK